MDNFVKQRGATLPGIWVMYTLPIFRGLGGPHENYTTSGGAAHPQLDEAASPQDWRAECSREE